MQTRSFRLRSDRRHIGSVLLGLCGLGLAVACSAPSASAPPGATPAAGESAPLAAGAAPATDAPQLGKSPIEEVIRAMTRDEKVRLVMGTGMDMAGGAPSIAPP